MIRWVNIPVYPPIGLAIAVALLLTEDWSRWSAAVLFTLGATVGAELGVWVDRRYVERRAQIDRARAEATSDLAAAKRRLARAKLQLAASIEIHRRVEELTTAKEQTS